VVLASSVVEVAAEEVEGSSEEVSEEVSEELFSPEEEASAVCNRRPEESGAAPSELLSSSFARSSEVEASVVESSAVESSVVEPPVVESSVVESSVVEPPELSSFPLGSSGVLTGVFVIVTVMS